MEDQGETNKSPQKKFLDDADESEHAAFEESTIKPRVNGRINEVAASTLTTLRNVECNTENIRLHCWQADVQKGGRDI